VCGLCAACVQVVAHLLPGWQMMRTKGSRGSCHLLFDNSLVRKRARSERANTHTVNPAVPDLIRYSDQPG